MSYPYSLPKSIGEIEVTVAMLRLGGKKKKLTLTQIVEKIKTMYGYKERSTLPVGEVKDSMRELIAQGDIIKKGNYYYLEDDIFEKMKRIEKRYNL